MKILIMNAGSSSLKYQLMDMDGEKVLAKGNCERIGVDGHLGHKTAAGFSLDYDADFPTHKEALKELIKVLTTGNRHFSASCAISRLAPLATAPPPTRPP